MFSSPRNIKHTLAFSSNTQKIASLRSKLKDWPEIAEEMESLVETLTVAIEMQGKTIAALESHIKNIFSNLKQAHFHSNDWFMQ